MKNLFSAENEIISAFSPLPFYGMLSEKTRHSFELSMRCSGKPYSAHSFGNFLSVACILILFAVFASCLMLSFPVADAIAYSFVAFAACALFSLRAPSILAARHAALVEADLPMALREFALCLNIKMPFEKALRAVASGEYACSGIFSEAARSIDAGSPVQSSISNAASRVQSLALNRAAAQMSSAYEEGGGGEALIMLADNLAAEQLARVREFGSRVAFGGLLYIASAALLPSLFLILAIGTSLFSGGISDASFVFLFYLIIVPLANLVVLSFVSFSSPPAISTTLAKNEDDECAHLMRDAGISFPLRQSIVPVSFAFLLFGVGIAAALSFSSAGILVGILVALLPHLALGYFQALSASRTFSIETALPIALMSASSQPRSFSLEKALRQMSSSQEGPLSDEFAAVSRQIEAGSPVQSSLSSLAARTPSVLLRRTVTLLLVGYKTGASMQKALREAAQDIASLFSLIRERSSALALQRYTLIGASILVPLILASMLSFSSELAATFAKMQSGGVDIFTSSGASPLAIAQAAAPACQIYLVLYSIVTAAFLSMQEGRRERFFTYAALLCLLSQLVWFFARA